MLDTELVDLSASFDPAVREQLLVLDAHLRVKAASDSFYAAFNVRPNQTLGKKLADLANGLWNIPPLLKLVQDLLTIDGESDDVEMECDFPGKGRRSVLVSARRLSAKDARGGMILLSIRNGGGQDGTDAETGESRSQARTNPASICNAVIVADPNSRITYMNPAAEQLTGWNSSDALQKPLPVVFDISNHQCGQTNEYSDSNVNSDQALAEMSGHKILVARDGTERPIENAAAPIVSAAGDRTGFVLVFHDITSRQKAERELEISETRYRRLFEAAHDGILILDAVTAKVLDVNRFLGDLLGYRRDYFLGKELWEIGIFKDAEASKAAMHTLQETGTIRYEDLPLKHRDGRCIPVEFVSNVYREGTRDVIQCNIRDIAERKLAEEALRTNEGRYRTLFEYAENGILISDPNGCYIDANPSACRMLDYSREELIGKSGSDIICRTAVPNDNPALNNGNSDNNLEWKFKRKDGSTFAAEVITTVMPDGCVVAMIRDFSERKRVMALSAQLAAIVESSEDAIMSKTLDGIIVTWNTGAERIFGYTAAEAVGRPVAMLFPPDRLDEEPEILDRIRRGEHVQHYETVRIAKSGRRIDVSLTASPVRDPQGRIIGVSKILRDVTVRKLAQAELSKAKEDAEAANRSKSEFLANMSHEIRTPMTAILGFAEMLLNRSPEECEEVGCVQIIRRNALHLLELINEILDLSKIEARQMTVECIPCDLPDLLADIVSLIRPRAAEQGLTFSATFEGAIPRIIQTDPTRLRQILLNLLGNAKKFTQAGNIEMRIKDEGDGGPNILLRVDVIDSGIGMSPQQLKRLFQPFTQGDDSITRKFGGTGLGLTISQRFAKLLNGDITVTSEIGVGSTFTLRIDGGSSKGIVCLHGLNEATLPARLDLGDHPNIQLRGHLLLVEDGRDNQRLLQMVLSDAGATVVVAENGQIGVDLATTQHFDLILMDMQMPVMDGYAATAELRRRGLKIPIIALTALAMAEDRAKCMASGCNAYLSKPITEELFLNTVNEQLTNGLSPATDVAQPVAAPSPSKPVVNNSGCIKSSLSGNPRMMKIIPEFVGGLPGEVHKLIDFMTRNDLDALKRVVHQLRGACGGYGFEPVTEPASRAEESIKAGKALESISAEVKSLIEVIRRIDGYDEANAQAAAEQSAE